MTILFPDGVQQLGNTSVAVVQTMAAPGSPSLATDLNAASTVNVSCFLYSGAEPAKNANKGTKPRRLCTRRDVETFGTITYEVSDLVYTYDPQADSTATANKARAALTEGSTVYLVIRRGLAAETTAFAAAQKVDVWKVKLGPQNKTRTGDGDQDEFSITQSVTVAVAGPWEDVAIAA